MRIFPLVVDINNIECRRAIMLTLDKIYHASFVLKKIARKTDLIAAPNLAPGLDLYLKTENLQ